jgi:lipopolysaccharide exporter
MSESEAIAESTTSNRLKKNASYIGDVLKLASGTAFAQALAILITPIITRLYNPDAFGLMALFISIGDILAVIACLRYEPAIMLPKKDEEAANLLGLCLALATIISILITAVVWLIPHQISSWLNVPKLVSYLWLVPLYVFINGAFVALNYWNSRTGKFGQLSIAKIAKSISSLSIQVAAGFAGYATGGWLIGAVLAGSTAATLMLGGQIWRANGRLLKESLNWQCMIKGFKRYHDFPLYYSWAELLNSVSVALPTFLLATYFSSTIVGYYALAIMVLEVPIALICSASGQVFFQRASLAKSAGNLAPMVERTFLYLGKIGIYPFLALPLIGKDFFVFIFGASWAEAGIYSEILAIWICLIFFTTPITPLFAVLEKQKYYLLFNILLIFTRAITLIVGGQLGNARIALALFSAAGFLIWSYICFWLLQKAGVSGSIITKKFCKPFAYSIPSLCLIAWAKWLLNLNPELIIFASIIATIIYYILIINDDALLKSSIKSFIK